MMLILVAVMDQINIRQITDHDKLVNLVHEIIDFGKHSDAIISEILKIAKTPQEKKIVGALIVAHTQLYMKALHLR